MKRQEASHGAGDGTKACLLCASREVTLHPD